MKLYGLIGKSLSHSFSARYFNHKFRKAHLQDHLYLNIELDDIADLTKLIHNIPELQGVNVTIPYKTAILPYLDSIEDEALAINAVNTIVFNQKGMFGYNTDWLGFTNSLPQSLLKIGLKSLVLGTGGGSKAIVFALKRLDHEVTIVSSSNSNYLNYDQIEDLSEYDFIVNTTPLGMYPDVESVPALPYSTLTGKETLYDLVYNPELTKFMQEGRRKGCNTFNGMEMLRHQAEAAWKIWQAVNKKPHQN